jgi:alcohol dehydrogenase class IV
LFGKSTTADFVIGFGGGSVIDSAKAISAMITNRGEVVDYLEVVGKGKKITHQPLPMIAIPTTAGTGSEVTRNAVVSSAQHHVKVSMRSELMIPRVALVDPELTYSMPPSVTASTGMDALVQCLEPYVSNKNNPLTDALVEKGIKVGVRSLLAAYQDGSNNTAREGMALTSLLGGLALANSGLGAVHGFAGVIGGMYDAPHGVICARLLGPVMKYNVRKLTQSPGNEKFLDRYRHIAQWLTGRADASIEEGLNWVDELTETLSIPRLRTMGVKPDDFEKIISKTSVSSSYQKNPIELETDTLYQILRESH